MLIVAVKPQDIEPLLDDLAGTITPGTLVVSLCAGLPTALYERHLPAGTPVVRVMPNTPMLVGEAMSAISPGSHATAADTCSSSRTCCPRSARWCGCRRRSRTR